MANGGREQLFNISEDPNELKQLIGAKPDVASRLREIAVEALSVPNADRALKDGKLHGFPYSPMPRVRSYQFDLSRGVHGFPKNPADVLGG